MSGHELKDEQIGIVRRPSAEQRAQYALRLARQAVKAGHSRDSIVDVLEHLGLVAPAQPSGGKTNPTGRNIPPSVQAKRREANAAAKRRAREQRKRNEKEAS